MRKNLFVPLAIILAVPAVTAAALFNSQNDEGVSRKTVEQRDDVRPPFQTYDEDGVLAVNSNAGGLDFRSFIHRPGGAFLTYVQRSLLTRQVSWNQGVDHRKDLHEGNAGGASCRVIALISFRSSSCNHPPCRQNK